MFNRLFHSFACRWSRIRFWEECALKKSIWGLVACIIGLLCPQFVEGQSLSEDGQSILWGISHLWNGRIHFRPAIKFGYQKTAINLSFPVPIQPDETNSLIDTLDVKFNDTNFWIGSLCLDLTIGTRAGLFLEATASPSRGASLTTSFAGIAAADYFGGTNGWMGWSWPTSGLQWWEINAQGRIVASDQFAFLAGYKVDRLSQKLSAPPEPSYQGWFPPDPPYTGPVIQDYFGDVKLTTYCPYVGIRVGDSWWNFSLIWSPWLTSYNVQMPLRAVFYQEANYPGYFVGFVSANSENKFSLRRRNGQLVEALGDLQYRPMNTLDLSMWLKGSWLNCRGSGLEESISAFLDAEVNGGGITWNYDANYGGGDATSSYSRYLWAVGVTGQLIF